MSRATADKSRYETLVSSRSATERGRVVGKNRDEGISERFHGFGAFSNEASDRLPVGIRDRLRFGRPVRRSPTPCCYTQRQTSSVTSSDLQVRVKVDREYSLFVHGYCPIQKIAQEELATAEISDSVVQLYPRDPKNLSTVC